VVFTREFNNALQEKIKGSQFPFVIFYKPEQRIIGSTRLLYLQPAHRKLEIGWTWLHPDYWHTAVNAACKSLLLAHCFDVMKAVRVQLKTDENNVRSRRAIEKTGARFEGILRNDMIRDDGTYRNSAYYSIVEGEWAPAEAKRDNK
jgi:RimJ/RimL family protein N-acetyltransferase